MRQLVFVLLALLAPVAFGAATLESPATAEAGATIKLRATGSSNPRDFVTVVPKGTREGNGNGDMFHFQTEMKHVPISISPTSRRYCAGSVPRCSADRGRP